MFLRPCWLGGHTWRRDRSGLWLERGTDRERQCNILVCTRCDKARIFYGSYPPRRIPAAPGETPQVSASLELAPIRYAIERVADDGQSVLTVFEDGNACSVTLSASQAMQLADLLTRRSQ